MSQLAKEAREGPGPRKEKLWIVFHCGRDAFRLQNSRFFFRIRKVRSAVRVSVIQTFLACLLSLPCRFDTRFKLLVRIPPVSLEFAKCVLQSRMLWRLCLLDTESFLCLNCLELQWWSKMFARGSYHSYLHNMMVSQFLLARKLLASFQTLDTLRAAVFGKQYYPCRYSFSRARFATDSRFVRRRLCSGGPPAMRACF